MTDKKKFLKAITRHAPGYAGHVKMPYFCQLCLKLSYMIKTNPFRIFIRVQKYIEFHPPPYEIPQLWSYLCTYVVASAGNSPFCKIPPLLRD